MVFNEQEVIAFIKEQSSAAFPDWVRNARNTHKTLNALVNGVDFAELLIDKIEFIESNAKANARKKYARDIRDLFYRVMNKRQNVFQANGGSSVLRIDNDTTLTQFNNRRNSFKATKSIFRYLSENFFQLQDIDPNGLLMLEYRLRGEEYIVYPTYKSIKDIRNYEPYGQLVEWVIFEPEKSETGALIWTLVDDETHWVVTEISGVFVLNKDRTFKHPFGQVPAVILSDIEKVGSLERVSHLEPAVELAKDYARDKSILSIYKAQKGFPIHWRFVSQCKTCTGAGKVDGNSCSNCDGKGYLTRGDVTDMVTLPIPKEGQPNIAPNIAGFISPDLETWTQYQQDLKSMEVLIEDTIWGTSRLKQAEVKNETATGRYIDVQPITNALNAFTDVVEWVDNQFSNWLLNFVDPVKKRNEALFQISYGRRYIIESPDILLQKYQEAKIAGDNNTILDKLLEEFILSKYKSDANMQGIMLKKCNIEPYIHMDIEVVDKLYGPEQSFKKISFQEFWEQADKTKDQAILEAEFEVFNTALFASSKIGENIEKRQQAAKPQQPQQQQQPKQD